MLLELPFTFADFAAQDGHYAEQFYLVPPQFWTDDLILLGEYLKLSSQDLYAKVPFIWMVDDQNRLQKAAVAAPLVVACQERLDFWHFLQENAGIHSYHVELATEQLRQELEEDFSKKTIELQSTHAAELDTVKEKEVRATMERLANAILNLGESGVMNTISSSLKSVPVEPLEKPVETAPTETPQPDSPPKEEVKAAASTSEMPWIETSL